MEICAIAHADNHFANGTTKIVDNATEMIAWAIPRIAQGCYFFSSGPEGRELIVTERSPSLEEMEAELSYGRPESERQVLARLRENCTMGTIRDAFVLLFGEKLGNTYTEQFEKNAPRYEMVLFFAYKQEKTLIRNIQEIFVREREGLVPGSGARNLTAIENHASPEAARAAVQRKYAEELSQLFPRLLRRAEQLNVLPVEHHAPVEVQTYLREASKSFIYGQFIACLIVCRSAIDFALRERLSSGGRKRDLERLRLEKKDTLENVLSMARESLSWKLKPTLDEADEVRRNANNAVHEKAPDSETCKRMFIKTRGLLRELYS